MPPTPADFAKRIADILQSVQLLPDEAKAPILHYRRTVAEISGALGYVWLKTINPQHSTGSRYPGAVQGSETCW